MASVATQTSMEACIPETAERAAAILLIGPTDSRRGALRNILIPSQWEIREADSYKDAAGHLDNRGIAVAICDTDVPDGNWQALLADLLTRANPPKLIVSARLADERLWAEVLNLGGYDVLMQPFDRHEVLRVTRMARTAWLHEGTSKAV